MTVYVDPLFNAVPQGDTALARQARRHGRQWCHLWSDSLEELHAMADRLGLKRTWFQKRSRRCLCHYDLVPSKRTLALKLGAVEISGKDYLRMCQANGTYDEPFPGTTPVLPPT